MWIISLNVGLPSAQRYEGRKVITGGAKKPVRGAMLHFGNFEGDGQADQVNHGGLEKAVCVYPFDHYPYWSRQLGRDLKPGAFSENLTVFGAIETKVCVGDVFRIGEAIVQVSQPRMPCAKLAGKNESKMLPNLIANVGYTGFYMRVLAEGLVAAGDSFDLERAHPERITIAEVNSIIYEKFNDVALIERLAELAEFSELGRTLFAHRLQRLARGEVLGLYQIFGGLFTRVRGREILRNPLARSWIALVLWCLCISHRGCTKIALTLCSGYRLRVGCPYSYSAVERKATGDVICTDS